MSVAVLSNYPFDAILALKVEPTLQSFETTGRIFKMADGRKLDVGTLTWVKEKWLPSAELLADKNFYAAVKSFASLQCTEERPARSLRCGGLSKPCSTPLEPNYASGSRRCWHPTLNQLAARDATPTSVYLRYTTRVRLQPTPLGSLS
jgi:hypothetical protein